LSLCELTNSGLDDHSVSDDSQPSRYVSAGPGAPLNKPQLYTAARNGYTRAASCRVRAALPHILPGICGQQVALHWAPGINRQLPDASRSRVVVSNPNGSGVTPRIQSSMRSVSISTKAAFARSCSLGKYTL